MLNLREPLTLEGYDLHRDDEVAHRFYLMPGRPRIPVGSDGAPEFLMVHYVHDDAAPDGELTGGYIQLRCTVAPSDEVRGRIVTALRALLTEEKARGATPLGNPVTTTEPVLASPTWKSGTVNLETFEVSDTGPVRKATPVGSPNLNGEPAVTAVVQLGDAGATMFAGALDPNGPAAGEIMLAVSFQLEYLARAPGISIDVTASRKTIEQTVLGPAWLVERVHGRAHLQKRAWPMEIAVAGRMAWLRAQTGPFRPFPVLPKKQLPTLLKTTIQITVKEGEAAATEGVDALREAAITAACNLLSEQLVAGALLGSALPAGAVEGEDDAAHPIHIEDVPDTTFTLQLRHDGVLVMPAGSNGPLDVLLTPEQLARCYKRLPPGDPYFAKQRVLVTSRHCVDFVNDGISLIIVKLAYDETDGVDHTPFQWNQDVRLDAEHDELECGWPLVRKAGGGFIRRYRFKVQLQYAANLPGVETPWQVVEGGDTILPINPQQLSALRARLTFAPATGVESVKVELEHTTSTGVRYAAVRELAPGRADATWFQHTGEVQTGLARPVWRYRATWRVKGLGEVVDAWVQTDTDEAVVFSTPFSRTLRFTVQPQGFDADTQSISGSLAYRHDARRYNLARTFRFDAATAPPAVIELDVFADGPEEATIEWSLVRRDLSRVNGTALVQPGSFVWAGPPRGGELTIEVSPLLVDFETDVQLAIVTLRYEDVAHGIREQKVFQIGKQLNNTTASAAWTVPLADPTRTHFALSVQYVAYDRTKSTRLEELDRADPFILLERPIIN